jgi:5-hydroxyisourate hydrolase-like protein (transthyretin family)
LNLRLFYLYLCEAIVQHFFGCHIAPSPLKKDWDGKTIFLILKQTHNDNTRITLPLSGNMPTAWLRRKTQNSFCNHHQSSLRGFRGKLFTMKNLIILILSIFTLSFLVSCDKDDPILPTIVNGQVLEQGSNKPLEGVKVVLMEGTYNGIGSGTYSFYPIDTFLTDKNGKYSYEHKTPFDKKAYELWYFKDKYFDISSVSENDRITRIEYNKTKAVSTKMYPFPRS